jgi:aldehyde:ferredoxin oxidoreductase
MRKDLTVHFLSSPAAKKLLRVNLGKKTFTEETIPEEVIRRYIGGKGLAAHYAYNEIQRGTNPLSPDNKLFLFNGILTGIFPGFTRYVVASKSPATGIWCDAYSGGRFGQELARTGYMGIAIEGRAPDWSYLKIDGDAITIEGSEVLEGKNAYERCSVMKPFSATVIGEAGRHMVNYACIMNDMDGPGRAGVIGRGGLGAIMGSKKLDAIALRGKLKDRDLIPPEKAKEVSAIYVKAINYMRAYVVKGIDLGGNLPAVEMCAGAKVLPVNNFNAGVVEGWEKMAVPEIRKVTIKKHTCPLCPLACGVHVKSEGEEVDRIEYETVALNGFNCGYTDFSKVIRLCRICNELGMDTMSAGVVASFAMECTEKGIFDFGVKFGELGKHEAMLRRIASRQGNGNILADGVRKASVTVGAESLAVQIKGLEFPGYDPRGAVGMALAYATSDRGACHLRAWTITSELNAPFTMQGKADLTKRLQDRNAALWTLIGCDNVIANSTGDQEEWVSISLEMLGAVGIAMDRDEFYEVGERIYNLTRLFNVREGMSRKDDYLPAKMHEGRGDTGWKLGKEDFDKLLDTYYELRGWDRNGIPTPEKLKSLGLQP